MSNRWSVRLIGVLLLVSLLSVCVDQAPEPEGPDLEETALSTEAQVSNVTGLTAASGAIASILQAGATDGVVYVSLPVGVVASGVSAEVRRKGDEVPVVTKMLDGGFDPVAIVAGEGDSIQIVVKGGGGQVLVTMKEGVKTKRPPTVVRTFPPRKKSDMPINAPMVLVLSEPVDETTVTSSSVRLYAGSGEIAGQARVLDDRTSVAFIPSAPLPPLQEYRLVIGKSIADLQGEVLGADVVVGFTTGTSTVGAPSSIVVSPDSIVLLVGSTYQFSAKVFDADGNLLLTPVTWHSNTVDLISISPTGLATALQTPNVSKITWGNGRIEARVGTLSASAFVAIVPQPASIEILPPSAALAVGDTLALEVVTRMSVPPFSSRIMVPLTISNSNPAAVSVSVPDLAAIQVSPFRTVRALTPGTARITVKGGGISAATNITVTAESSVGTVRVAPASAEMMVQETLQLTAWLRDANGRIMQNAPPVSWSSSNTSVLTVSGGNVTAIADGTATITATSEGKTGSAAITVSAQPQAPTFIDVMVNHSQGCGVTATLDTYCWGGFFDRAGQPVQLRVPTLLPGGLNLVAVSPSVTVGYLCGRANAGETFCWSDYTSTPYRFAEAFRFSDLSTSLWGHGCGIATNGSTYCWGDNVFGQLGDGTTVSRAGIPTAVIGGHAFKSVAVAEFHSCGVTTAGDAYCWGANIDPSSGDPGRARGLLGSGDSTTAIIPAPVRVAGGLTFTQLSAGRYHTCGIATDGQAYCWGRNWGGAIGDGTQTNRGEPTAVETSLRFIAISARSIAHTCAVATDSGVYCWGSNSSGELGVDQSEDCSPVTGKCRRTPVAVQGNPGLVRIFLGAAHSCGATASGRLYCWGYNGFGQLGDGTTVSRSLPKPVSRPR